MYEALADGVRLLCLDNRLPPHTGLPAERELAATLGVSRATVASAYSSLRSSGHIESVGGSGSVTLPQRREDPGLSPLADDGIDLQRASPPAWPGLAGLFAHVAADAAPLLARLGHDTTGSLALRTCIAERYTAAGEPTDPEQILVTNGAQSAIALIARTLSRRGDRVAIETPTYPHAAEAFREAGGRLVPLPVSARDGWDLDRAQDAISRAQPSLAYLMPRFHNPTGAVMSPLEQATFESLARRQGATLIVDETTADLAIDEEPGLSFTGAPVIRIGSLSKSVWGGLRIGWVRARADVIRRLAAARPSSDLGTPEWEQAVAVRVFDHLPEVLSQRSAFLRAGRDRTLAALAHFLPEWDVPRVSGGVSLWAGLDRPLSSALVLAAREERLYLSAGARFAATSGHDQYLRIPFTAPEAEMQRAVEILSRVWPHVIARVPRSAQLMTDSVV